jgi:hypothetical protein
VCLHWYVSFRLRYLKLSMCRKELRPDLCLHLP